MAKPKTAKPMVMPTLPVAAPKVKKAKRAVKKHKDNPDARTAYFYFKDGDLSAAERKKEDAAIIKKLRAAHALFLKNFPDGPDRHNAVEMIFF